MLAVLIWNDMNGCLLQNAPGTETGRYRKITCGHSIGSFLR